ncbi:MAG: calcium-binding protein [Betaproteobacteria bacterium]|nr:calcium-binding protein [Betaproteobacteria bacterium]
MAFHLYRINELYSNADGTIQFIELVIGNINFESFWQGETVTVTQAGTSAPPPPPAGYYYSLESATNTYTFPSNLPSTMTANTSVLLATQGFANLGLVTPDFIIPSGFLFINGGTVNYGSGSDIVTYSLLPTDGTSSINRSSVIGVNSPTDFAGATGTIQSNVIGGDDGPNNLSGTSGDDVMAGAGGDDTLTGSTGNDTIDGGAGLDTAVFSGQLSAYTIGAGGATVAGPDGSDTLTGIERLQFSDKGVAFDLGAGQAAGNTVRIIGAAFDANNIIPEFVGIGLQLFDGGMSMLQVSQLALGTQLYLSIAGSTSNEAFVNTVYENVVGAPPSQGERDFYVGLLQGSGGTMTQAELLVLAANADVNTVNINLVGLQQSGVEFV